MKVNGLLDSVSRDFKYAVRSLRRSRTVTAVVLLTLALSIGANTAVFSVLDGVLLKPLPYPRAEELVALRQTAPGAAGSGGNGALNLSPSMYFTFAENNRVFQSLGVWIATHGTVTELGEPEQVAPSASATAFSRRSTFRPRPAAGSGPRSRTARAAAAERLQGLFHGDAELRLLAAAFRRGPRRGRTHDHGRYAP